CVLFFFSSRRRHTRFSRDWSSDVCSSDLGYRPSFKNLVGWFSAEEMAFAKSVIAEVGLSEMMDRRVEQLSGGQKQRVGIARAMEIGRASCRERVEHAGVAEEGTEGVRERE